MFDANGDELVNVFRVNETTSGTQYLIDVVMRADGSMLCLWYGNGVGDSAGVFGRLFSAQGVALGGEFRINSNTSGEQDSVHAAYGPNGYFVVFVDCNREMIVGRFVDFNGALIGNEFDVGPWQSPAYGIIDVATLPGGNFGVVWSAINSASGRGRVPSRVQRRRASVGLGTGCEFDDKRGPNYPRIGPDAKGNTLIVWLGEGIGDSSGVFARQYAYQFADAQGIYNAVGGTVNLKDTIVANNTATHSTPDVEGAFTSQGGNLIGDQGKATGLTNAVNSDKVGTDAAPIDPKLGPLADNGGPTKTHLPAADSPAIDAGIDSGAPSKDQRGVDRKNAMGNPIVDGNNDGTPHVVIGAVERYYATISGRKFHDARVTDAFGDIIRDYNGIQDAGEEGLAGWTMYLDVNQNNQLDDGEPTSLTDASGNCKFTQLLPGVSYTVAEVNQPGWTRTYVSTNYVADVEQGQPDSLGATVQGLTGVQQLAFSPDGKHVYAISSNSAGADAVSHSSAIQRLARLLSSPGAHERSERHQRQCR